ncbi:MAG: DUF5657 family protein [Microgenomates group bacterium]
MIPQDYTSIGFLIAKVFIVISLVLYAIYAWIMVRQEQLMSKVLAETSEAVLRLLTIIHLVAAVFVIILALILL